MKIARGDKIALRKVMIDNIKLHIDQDYLQVFTSEDTPQIVLAQFWIKLLSEQLKSLIFLV